MIAVGLALWMRFQAARPLVQASAQFGGVAFAVLEPAAPCWYFWTGSAGVLRTCPAGPAGWQWRSPMLVLDGRAREILRLSWRPVRPAPVLP